MSEEEKYELELFIKHGYWAMDFLKDRKKIIDILIENMYEELMA